MVSRNTTLVPSLGLCVGPACQAGLSTGMRREHVTPNKKEKRTGVFPLRALLLLCASQTNSSPTV